MSYSEYPECYSRNQNEYRMDKKHTFANGFINMLKVLFKLIFATIIILIIYFNYENYFTIFKR